MKNRMERLKVYLNKDVTKTMVKYKLPIIGVLVVILLAFIGIFITYAYYQVDITTPIVGSTIDRIADIDVRIMAEERDTNGSGLGSYSLYPYIPKAGYKYNATKSYCTNGSVINYDAVNYQADVAASGHDVCYLYFDSEANLDLTLYVYAENVDSDGNGTGTYTKLETTVLPTIGYELHEEDDEYRSYCENGSTISYDGSMFTIEADGKDVCYAYMDAVNVDIALKLFVQAKEGSSYYYETNSIPTSAVYAINEENSSCTGTSTLSMENQKVIINATSRTSCVAYLDVSSGAALASLSLYSEDDALTVAVEDSELSTEATTYYYSVDGGATYASSSSNSYTFTDVDSDAEVQVYSEDAYGNTSAILSTDQDNDYVYNGVFPYKNAVQTLTIKKSGYYYIQTWGAQGGYRTSSDAGGKGGYASGYVYLNEGDNLFIHTGGAGGNGEAGCGTTICEGGYNGGGYRYKYYGGGGASDVRLGTDDLLARIIVAGGGGSDGGSSNAGMYAGGYTGGSSTSGTSAVSNYGGKGGNTTYSGYSKDYTIATQTTTGLNSNTLENYAGGFGFGGAGTAISGGYGGAGGGGWYGGAGNVSVNTDDARGGGGGSSFILSAANASSLPSGYLVSSSYYFQKALTVAGNSSFESPTGMSETGHEGNGTVKITYIGDAI